MPETTDADNQPLNVLVRLKVRPGKIAAAEQALTRIADPTRANPDCLEFRILHSTDDDATFILLERWVSAAANAAHAQRDYMAEYMATKDEIFTDIDGEFVAKLHPVDAH